MDEVISKSLHISFRIFRFRFWKFQNVYKTISKNLTHTTADDMVPFTMHPLIHRHQNCVALIGRPIFG